MDDFTSRDTPGSPGGGLNCGVTQEFAKSVTVTIVRIPCLCPQESNEKHLRYNFETRGVKKNSIHLLMFGKLLEF